MFDDRLLIDELMLRRGVSASERERILSDGGSQAYRNLVENIHRAISGDAVDRAIKQYHADMKDGVDG